MIMNACRIRLMTRLTSSIDCRGTVQSISTSKLASNKSYHVSIKTNTTYPKSKVSDQVESLILKGIYIDLARQVHLQSFISMKSSNHHNHHEDIDEDITDDGAALKIQHRSDDSSNESLNSFI